MLLNILTVPGLGSSGPLHWQTQWEQQYGYQRVEQRNWDAPVCAEWVQTLERAVAAAGPGVVLAAHSLACATIAHWARTTHLRIGGALLVGPADVDRPDFPAQATGFAPMPLQQLPFPSIVVASTNDEYVSLDRARQFAHAWGSRFVGVGEKGHLNSASGLGLWPEGHALLQELG